MPTSSTRSKRPLIRSSARASRCCARCRRSSLRPASPLTIFRPALFDLSASTGPGVPSAAGFNLTVPASRSSMPPSSRRLPLTMRSAVRPENGRAGSARPGLAVGTTSSSERNASPGLALPASTLLDGPFRRSGFADMSVMPDPAPLGADGDHRRDIFRRGAAAGRDALVPTAGPRCGRHGP